MTLHEVSEATSLVQRAVGDDANIIFGAVVDESLNDELMVTVIATGFGSERATISMGGRDAARAEQRREAAARELPRPAAAQVASITPLAARERREVEMVPPVAPVPVAPAAPAPRPSVTASAAAVPAARLEAPEPVLMAPLATPTAVQPETAHAYSSAAAPWLALELEDEPAPAPAFAEPAVAERLAQKRHVSLPKPGLPSWSADDLDVPAFLRRQMD
jgi:cell division protein FtsZ